MGLYTTAMDARIGLFYESQIKTQIYGSDDVEWKATINQDTFSKECFYVTDEISDTVSEYFHSKRGKRRGVITLGEGVLVKGLMNELDELAEQDNYKLFNDFSPPLAGVMGGLFYERNPSEINGMQFKSLYESAIEQPEDGGFFGFGMIPFAIGMRIDGGFFQKAIYQFMQVPVSNELKFRPCHKG